MAINLQVNDNNNFALFVDSNEPMSLSQSEVITQLVNDYNALRNKPSINGVELIGDKTLEDLGITILRIDTTTNWNLQRDLIAAYGTIYVYSDYQNVDGLLVPGIKIGDGTSYLIDMPFIGSVERDMLLEHIQDNVRHITVEERTFWNNKVDCFVSNEDSENLVFTRDNV